MLMNMHEAAWEGKHTKQLYLIKLLAGLAMEAGFCFNPLKTIINFIAK